MDSVIAPKKGSVDDVVARIERMPISSWHLKARFIVGVATFFDGFDALAIAYVLPVIAPQWHLSPPQIGLLLSASFFGQLLAALFFGWFAERYGRMPAIIWSTLIYSVMSLGCAFAWDFNSLLVLRTLQGIGIGGEVPVAITYIAELSRAERRGRFLLLYELVFPDRTGRAVLVGALVVPHIGWQLAVHHRRVSGIGRLLHAAPAAGIAALARHQGPLCRGGCGGQHDRTAVERSNGPLPAGSARGQSTRACRLACLICSVSEYLGRTLSVLGDLGRVLLLQLRPRRVAPEHLPNGLSPQRQRRACLHAVTQTVGLIGCLVCALSIDQFHASDLVRGRIPGRDGVFRLAGLHQSGLARNRV